MIDDKLSFSSHVEYVKKKVKPRLRMLHKYKYVLNRKLKKTLYKTLIVPLFDYGDIAFDCLTLKDSDTLQKLQNAALCLILLALKETHIKDMHSDLNLITLAERRKHHSCHQVYKNLQGEAPAKITQMTQEVQSEHSMSLRSVQQHILYVPNYRLESTPKGFRYRGPHTWNLVEEDCKHSTSLPSFKRSLYNSNYLGSF